MRATSVVKVLLNSGDIAPVRISASVAANIFPLMLTIRRKQEQKIDERKSS